MFTSKIKLNVLNLNFLPKNDQKRVQNHQKSRNSGRSNDLISRKSWNFPKIARGNFEINRNGVQSIEISLFLIEKSSIDHDCIQKSCSIKPDSNIFWPIRVRIRLFRENGDFIKKIILEEQRLIFIQSKLDIQNINWKIKLNGHVGFTLK